MNPMQQQMKDPAAGVPRELLPHLHLISKNRYPVNNNPSLETIVAYLLEAPKVMREGGAVQWQFLDCPQDGTLFLTWQPPDLGMNFASDGYVWADQEAPFNSDVRGYTLQMFMHKSGLRPQGDAMACHSRRRYRLLPSQQSMGGPMPDPSLWLIHYSKANPRDHIAAASVPVAAPIHTQLQQRRLIMSAGALARKEFMLHDRSNWPTINLPSGIGRHPPGTQLGATAHRRGPSLVGHESSLEEEEDVSRGDALDFMTPRDISRMRYEQHHEWMEEILESPYRTMQIIPPDLGLGRKGELEALTKDFFEAPTGALQEPGTDATVPRVGRLDQGKAEEFTKLANQKLADMQLELQKMKQAHQRRMEKLRKVTTLSAAEKKLRSAPSELSQRKSVANGLTNSNPSDSDPIDDIVKEVEETTGKKIEQVKNVTCIAKGGYQDLVPNSGTNTEQTSNAMSSKPTPTASATGMQRQLSTPQNQQQITQTAAGTNPQSAQSSQANSSGVPVPKAEETPQSQNGQDATSGDDTGDIDMAELDEPPPADDVLGDANDWVMVDDTNMAENVDTPSLDNLAKSIGDSEGQDQTPINTGFTPADSADQTPQAADQQQQQNQQAQPSENQTTGHTPLDATNFDFDDMNTAGDALADYGADDDDLNLDNMDDSAFGDAFHPADDNDLS